MRKPKWQEWIPVGCVLPACWLYPIVSHVSGGIYPPPKADPPGCRPPGGRPPWCRPPWMQSPRLGSQPPMNRMTDTCENISLPQMRAVKIKSMYVYALLNLNANIGNANCSSESDNDFTFVPPKDISSVSHDKQRGTQSEVGFQLLLNSKVTVLKRNDRNKISLS